MKKSKVKELCNYWNEHFDDDVSTAMLIEMCRSKFNLDDAGDVVDYLKAGGVLKEENSEK